jgi:sugar lactone lactonase YvrE
VKIFDAAPASEERCILGEGPVWDGDRNRVLWVDIQAGAVHTGTLSGRRILHDSVLRFPGTVGAVVSSLDGAWLVAGSRRLYTVPTGGAVREGARILAEETPSRLNDGVCDPAGRFLVGSLALDGREHQEILVRVDTDGILVLDADLGMSNGLAFAPGGAQLYNVDTIPAVVWVRDYDAATGAVGRRHALLQLGDGKPDGLCVDSGGNLWIAMWGAGQVRCYSPAGEQVAVVDVAAPNTTSVAFVGPGLDMLLITTASEQLSAEQLAAFPDSGRLFIADVAVSGLPVTPWAGTGAASAPQTSTAGS